MKKNKETSDKMFNFGGNYTNFMSMLFDTLLLGILWLLCSIPIITIGASSTALYYSFHKSIKKGSGYALREFFSAFKGNIKQATLMWLGSLVILAVILLDIWIGLNKGSGNLFLFIVMFNASALIIWTLVNIFYFASLSRFSMPTRWLLKLSFYMIFKYLGYSILILLSILCLAAFVYRFPILILIVPGPVAFLLSEFIDPLLERHSAIE